MKRLLTGFGITFFVVGITSLACATPVIFFGEDLGGGENTKLLAYPNAASAETNFRSNLTGAGTEDFENFSGNTAIFPGNVSATLNGNGYLDHVPTGTDGNGRYPISGEYFWEARELFRIDFSEAISAFGFYGVDMGENGEFSLGLVNGETTNYINLGSSAYIDGGAVLYFGFYDLENSYTAITFNAPLGEDFFGLDDLTIGIEGQISPQTPVPEPATMLLFGTGLVGLIGFRLRKKK